MSLLYLGTGLLVNPHDIRSISPFGGGKGSTAPGEFFINVNMGEWTATHTSDWDMARVVETLRANDIILPAIEEVEGASK